MLRRYSWLLVVGASVLSFFPPGLVAGGGDEAIARTVAGSRSPLHDAVEAKDVDEVRRLLGEAAELEALNDRGETPLAAAGYSLDASPLRHPDSWRNRLDMVHLLAQAGAHVNALNRAGRTVLMEVARVGHRPELYLSNKTCDAWLLDQWGNVEYRVYQSDAPFDGCGSAEGALCANSSQCRCWGTFLG